MEIWIGQEFAEKYFASLYMAWQFTNPWMKYNSTISTELNEVMPIFIKQQCWLYYLK